MRISKEMRKELKVWADKVKERDCYKCCFCGSGEYLNAHHVIDKQYKPLRFFLDNGITLCAKNHKFDSTRSAHNNPIWFVEWFKEKFPARYNKLKEIVEEELNKGEK